MIGENVAASAGEAAGSAAKAAAPAAKAAGVVITAAKAAVLSPIFGGVVLCGVIAFEWWKGAKDAKGFATAVKADS